VQRLGDTFDILAVRSLQPPMRSVPRLIEGFGLFCFPFFVQRQSLLSTSSVVNNGWIFPVFEKMFFCKADI
jgi:hypothetical protein